MWEVRGDELEEADDVDVEESLLAWWRAVLKARFADGGEGALRGDDGGHNGGCGYCHLDESAVSDDQDGEFESDDGAVR